MKNKNVFSLGAKSTLALSVIAALLAGCGGGGGGGGGGGDEASVASQSSTQTDSGKVTNHNAVAAVKPAKDNWLMYAHDLVVYSDSYPAGYALPTSYLTRTFNAVNNDGTISYIETSSDTGMTFAPRSVTTLDATGAATRYVVDGSQTCSFVPGFMGVATSSPGFERTAGSYAVGDQWNVTSQTTCQFDGGVPFNGEITNTGSIVALEPISVRGLGFSAVKESYSVITKPGANAGSIASTKTDYTCWRDAAKGRVVRCVISQFALDKATGNYRRQYDSTLDVVGYSLMTTVPVTPIAPPVSPYGGNWVLNFTGTMSGSCLGVRVDKSGSLSGDCVMSGASTVSGLIKANNEISFKAGTNMTFTGRMDSPIEGHGVWTSTTGGSGSWTMSHR